MGIQANEANCSKICSCGSWKRKVRCKKCDRCLAEKCNECIFCLKPSWKKACVKRKCPYQGFPKCQHCNKKRSKSHFCKLCRISFIKESHIKQHIAEIHKNLKPLKCVKPDVKGPLVFLKKLESQQE